jgi:hypothetical protein
MKSSSVLSSAWNPWKFSKKFFFSCYQEYMHLGGSLQYHFAMMALREMMSDLEMVASSPPDEEMMAS